MKKAAPGSFRGHILRLCVYYLRAARDYIAASVRCGFLADPGLYEPAFGPGRIFELADEAAIFGR